MSIPTYDIIIIGGGVMGSATAFSLMKTDPSLKVTVIEPDPTYTRASTTLSLSNARIQFSLKENVQISQYAFEVLDRFEDEISIEGKKPFIAYRREGNLFLIDEAGRAAAERAYSMQKDLGCPIDWWSTEKIKSRYPLYEPSELVAGTFGSQDGHFDAPAVLMAYRKKAISLGAVYIKDKVEGIRTGSGWVEGVHMASGDHLTAKIVINCAGAWAADVARSAGVNLPILPIMRHVFVLDTEVKPEHPLPLTVLPSGLYFRSETGGLIVLGKSMESDPVGFDFTWDEDRFVEQLWPELAGFVPAFEALKIVNGWAGLYAVNTLDGNAILGEWPEMKGLYLANGFSGHGLQQAPAVGRYLAELITGREPALDLSIFSPERILENRPVAEGGLV